MKWEKSTQTKTTSETDTLTLYMKYDIVKIASLASWMD